MIGTRRARTTHRPTLSRSPIIALLLGLVLVMELMVPDLALAETNGPAAVDAPQVTASSDEGAPPADETDEEADATDPKTAQSADEASVADESDTDESSADEPAVDAQATDESDAQGEPQQQADEQARAGEQESGATDGTPADDGSPQDGDEPGEPGSNDATAPDDAATPDAATSDDAASPDDAATSDATTDGAPADEPSADPDPTDATDDATAGSAVVMPIAPARATAARVVVRTVARNGWDASHTRYYVNNVAQTGVVAIGSGSSRKFYLFSRSGVLIKSGYLAIDGRIYVSDQNGVLASLTGGRRRGWTVSSAYGRGQQRYYLYRIRSGANKGAYYAKPGYSKNGYAHYTRPEGYVVVGSYLTGKAQGSRIYLADATGRLASLSSGQESGWVTSNSWGTKKKRRYLLIRDTTGADAGVYYATFGYSTKRYAHYTTKKGYVRTKSWTSDGKVFVANAKGKMLTLSNTNRSKGWRVSSRFFKDGKTRRYYLYKSTSGPTAGAYYAKPGYASAPYAHYTQADGTVATNQTVRIPNSTNVYRADAKGKLTKWDRASIIENYCTWAVKIANDRRYGYSQYNRWTGADDAYVKKNGAGDFDCSSMVITGLRKAGLKVGSASYTGDMYQQLTKNGWQAIVYNGKMSSLRRGDILLAPTYHVEFYLGNGLRVGAHADEHGGIGSGAKLGDQLQKGSVAAGSYDYNGEISVRSSNYGWFTYVLRYKG